jgi:hypothetical protein
MSMLQSQADGAFNAASKVTQLLSEIGGWAFRVSRLFREQAPEYIDYGVAILSGIIVSVILLTLL